MKSKKIILTVLITLDIIIIAFVIYFLVNCIILISGKCIWTSSKVEDYKTGKYLEYNFPKEIKDYFPSYDDIKDDSIILEFEGYDANYNSPSLFQNKLNSYCKVAILYDGDLYENVKKNALSIEGIYNAFGFEAERFEAYEITPRKKLTFGIQFCDKLNIVIYNCCYNYHSLYNRADIYRGEFIKEWESKIMNDTGDIGDM